MQDSHFQKSTSIDNSTSTHIVIPYIQDFKIIDKKTHGDSPGYLADYGSDQYMLKEFYKKSTTEHLAMPRRDAINELIAGSLYQLLLDDLAPVIVLVRDSSNADVLYIGSKILKDVMTLAEKLGSKTSIYMKATQTIQLNHLEKVMAACHLLGEIDYHGENLLVDKQGRVFKIDHGGSFAHYEQDRAEQIKNMFSFGYNNMIFDIENYAVALECMMKKLIDNRKLIAHSIDEKIKTLVKYGFEIEKLYDYDTKQVEHCSLAKSIDFYQASIERNLVNFQHIIPIIQKVVVAIGIAENHYKEAPSNLSKTAFAALQASKEELVKFKQGGWLQIFNRLSNAEIGVVCDALCKNRPIDGESAIQWSYNKADENRHMMSQAIEQKTLSFQERVKEVKQSLYERK